MPIVKECNHACAGLIQGSNIMNHLRFIFFIFNAQLQPDQLNKQGEKALAGEKSVDQPLL